VQNFYIKIDCCTFLGAASAQIPSDIKRSFERMIDL